MTQLIRIEQNVLDDKRSFILDAAASTDSDLNWTFGAFKKSVALTVVSL